MILLKLEEEVTDVPSVVSSMKIFAYVLHLMKVVVYHMMLLKKDKTLWWVHFMNWMTNQKVSKNAMSGASGR